MKGAVLGGMVWALKDLGLTPAFDDVYGSSAGAMVGAYFLNGTPEAGTAIFYDHLAGRHFVRPWLAPFGGGLNLDLLFDAVMLQRTPLEAEKIASCGARFHPLVTNAQTKRVVDAGSVFDLSCQFGLASALRAAVRMPLICGNPWSKVPDLWRDAGLLEPVPLATPLEQGVTHLLLLRAEAASSAGGEKPRSSPLDRIADTGKRLLSRSGSTPRERQRKQIDLLPPERYSVIAPTNDRSYSTFCIDPQELRAYAEAGRRAAQQWWSQEQSEAEHAPAR